jgi:predicted nucleotidyltransferase
MRISFHERKVIQEEAQAIFGEGAEIFLFGSRADDSKRGGDIDLYIKLKNKDDLIEKKTRFLSRVKWRTEDQRIDVVFNEDSERRIEKEAFAYGIPLW